MVNQNPLNQSLSWVDTRYAPFAFPNVLHDIQKYYMKLLPKLNGEKRKIVEEHLSTFQYFNENFMVDKEYVFMRFFVQTLEGEVRKWFHTLPSHSINYWDDLHREFHTQYGEKKVFSIILLNSLD